MVSQTTTLPELNQLESYIGKFQIMRRPACLVKDAWDAAVQAEVIVSRVESSLQNLGEIYISGTDARLKLNRSRLGRELRETPNQPALLSAVRLVGREAGINPDGISLHKEYDDASRITGPAIYVILPNEDAARQLLDHVREKALQLNATEPA